MKRFEDANVLITGGSSGIGRATAARLVREGAKVIITGTHPQRLADTERELGVITIASEAGDPAAIDALVDDVRSRVDKLDALFLNAGLGTFVPHTDATTEQFDHEFHVNVLGPLLAAQKLAPLLRDGGSIVLTTSIVRTLGMQGTSVYAATKGALRSLTRTLARELAPRGIRVNAVSPGPIATNFFGRSEMDPAETAKMAEAIVANVPLGRFGTSDEVAAVASFLLSSEASFVTGSEYVVDGGLSQL